MPSHTQSERARRNRGTSNRQIRPNRNRQRRRVVVKKPRRK